MQHLKAWLQANQMVKESGRFRVLHRMSVVSLLLLLAMAGMTMRSSQAAATPSVSPHARTGLVGGRANLVRPLTGYEGARSGWYWAGYEAVDRYSYKEINGHWTVPSVSGYGDAAVWVGFNGDPTEVPSDWNGPFVQIGTDSMASGDASCLTGWKQSKYFAWVNAIGHGGNELMGNCGEYLFPVNPNDQITASISLSGDYAYLALDDTSTGQDKVITFNNGQNLSEFTAEWIVERNPGELCPPRLANFGTISWSNALLKAGNNNWYPITYNSYLVNNMNDNGQPTGTLLAQVSGLSSGNTAFTVQWHSEGIDNPGC
jgi:hypothetical protein